MSNDSVFIGNTREYTAAQLRSIALGWPAFIVECVVLLFVALLCVASNAFFPFVAVLASIVLFRTIVQGFLRDCLENESLPVFAGTGVGAYLSASVVAHCKKKKHISMYDLLQAASASERGSFVLEELGISAEHLLQTCKQDCEQTLDPASFLSQAIALLSHIHEKRVGGQVILVTLLLHTACGKKLMEELDMSSDDVQGLLQWEKRHQILRGEPLFWQPEAVAALSSVSRSWVMGYTDELDTLTSEVRTPPAHDAVIHSSVISQMMSIFNRAKQKNILLLGKRGVGKSTLVRNFAAALRKAERENHRSFTRVLDLHTEMLLSGVHDPDRFFLQALSRAQQSGHFVLIIRDFTMLLKASDAALRTVLGRTLEASNITLIGIADIADYHATIKAESGIDALFEKVNVEDANDEETLTVLMSHYFSLERKHIRVTYKALKAMLDLSKKYLTAQAGMPGKAVQVMDDAIQRAHEKGSTTVTEDHVRDVISVRGRVNVKKVSEDERASLLQLEEQMKKQIIDQDPAVEAVCNALKRARMDLSSRKKPIGTFLFLGPTGVGKTQTAKTLAHQYFGSSDAMIRLDMNEYSHVDSVFTIIGTSTSEGFLSQRVQDAPSSLILLDEIEKAHPSVLNLFLQILDEGKLNDGRGVSTDFRNTIIIATSNAGALFIRDFVRDHQHLDPASFKKAVIDAILQEKLFSPEFINRFDDVILFQPLSVSGAQKVAMLMLDEIVQEIAKNKGITVKLEEGVVRKLVEKGHSTEFGAREMRRTITDEIENFIADAMLQHNIKRGQEILIREQDFT